MRPLLVITRLVIGAARPRAADARAALFFVEGIEAYISAAPGYTPTNVHVDHTRARDGHVRVSRIKLQGGASGG